MAYGLGADLEAMSKGLEAVRPMPMRMAVERLKGVGVINDAYNANPASMDAALRTLAGVECKGERVAVLGDMLELGTEAGRRHYELGQAVARCQVDRLYLLGQFAAQVKEGALEEGMDDERVRVGKNHRNLARIIRRQTKSGDWLLFKGSRGIGMEKVLAAFKVLGD
jgi:UDP-N-acetylmuramyl pentapeptide synthase